MSGNFRTFPHFCGHVLVAVYADISDSGDFQVKHAPVPEGEGSSLAVDAFLHKNRAPSYPFYGDGEGDGDDEARQRYRPQPHGVFHAHAHDMAYLEEWIGEILDVGRDVEGGQGGVVGSKQGILP